MKKGWIITIISVASLSLIGFGVGRAINNGGFFSLMDSGANQIDKKELDKLKEQSIELLEWNYEGIDSVTFAWDTKETGLVNNDKVPELATTPMGSLCLLGYVNGDPKKTFNMSLEKDPNTNEFIIYGMSAFGLNIFDKNPEYRDATNNIKWRTHLKYADIQELKKQGYTKDITIEEIKEYFDKKNKEENNNNLVKQEN